MESFKQAAITILKEAGCPLHYREITERAIHNGLITPEGKTPWATMNATLSTEIVDNGEKSTFIRSDPGFYALRELQIKVVDRVQVKDIVGRARIIRHQITDNLNSKQKGDIAEARVAELIILYGKEGLSCYRPVSDHEGIDLIVKRRGKLQVSYIQIKSSYGYKDRGFVSSVREQGIIDSYKMLLVFVYYDHIFCIPAPDFLRLTKNEEKKPGERVFSVGLSHPDQSKYAEFMIEKRELANRIIELMDKT
jgi:hypothetical protein